MYTVDSMYIKLQKMQTNLQGQEAADQWLHGEYGERQEGVIIKGKEKTLKGDGYVHYLECCDGFMGIYKCQNVSDCVF